MCQRMKVKPQPAPEMRPLDAPRRPFEFITLDWLGGFPTNKHGNNSVLNIVCKFCEWVITIPCDKRMGSEDLCEVLYDKVFSWVGLPLKILRDRDTRLRASQMRALHKYLGVRLMMSTAYHPQTDGQSENFHKAFLSVLKALVNKYHSNWEEVSLLCCMLIIILCAVLLGLHTSFLVWLDTARPACAVCSR